MPGRKLHTRQPGDLDQHFDGVGELMRFVRGARGLTQAEVAVSRTHPGIIGHISQIETGRITLPDPTLGSDVIPYGYGIDTYAFLQESYGLSRENVGYDASARLVGLFALSLSGKRLAEMADHLEKIGDESLDAVILVAEADEDQRLLAAWELGEIVGLEIFGSPKTRDESLQLIQSLMREELSRIQTSEPKFEIPQGALLHG